MVSDVYETRDELPEGVLDCKPSLPHLFGFSVRWRNQFYLSIVAVPGVLQTKFGTFSFTWKDLFDGEFFCSHSLGVAIIYRYEVT